MAVFVRESDDETYYSTYLYVGGDERIDSY